MNDHRKINTGAIALADIIMESSNIRATDKGLPLSIRFATLRWPTAAAVHCPRDRGEPEVLLLDEPCSALDPTATGRIENLIGELRGDYSILIVTHNMHQAARISDFTALMYLGRLIEYGSTANIFSNPLRPETEDYVTGRFG